MTASVSLFESPNFFTGRAWGVLRANPASVYASCRASGRRYIMVRDNVRQIFQTNDSASNDEAKDKLNQYFDDLISMRSQIIPLDTGLLVDSQHALRYFLRVHQHLMRVRHVDKGQSSARDYRPTNVIFVEMTTHLSHTVEYFLLLFRYLLFQSIAMPQLFVIRDYPTDEFDFIEAEIFADGTPIIPWRPISLTLGGTLVPFLVAGRETDLIDTEKNVVRDIGAIQLTTYNFGHLQNLRDLLRGKGVTCVVISENNFYDNQLKDKEELKSLPLTVYEDINSFMKTPRRETNVDLLLLRTVEEFLAIPTTVIQPTVVVYDTRFRCEINMLYAGNVVMPVRPNEDYIKSSIWKIKQRSPNTHVRIYDEGKERVVRAIFTRSPVIDYIQMHMFDVDMILLYTNYYGHEESGNIGGGLRNFLSVVRSEADVLRTLKYNDPKYRGAFSRCVQLNIHPMVVSMIENWFRRPKLPRVAILVFAAVMLGADRNIVEIKEHGTREYENDVSQTSHYGKILFRYLDLMRVHESMVMEEGGRTSRLLRRFLDTYKITEDEMLLFDHNEFTHYLVKMILEEYPTFILKQSNQSIYRGIYNTQMNWRIVQTTNLPERLFPFAVSMSGSNRRVSLFIPLDGV